MTHTVANVIKMFLLKKYDPKLLFVTLNEARPHVEKELIGRLKFHEVLLHDLTEY